MITRVALITNIPSPYRLPVWDSLGRKVDALKVFICSEREPNRIWQSELIGKFSFTYKNLPGLHFFLQNLDWGIHFNPTLWYELDRYKPTNMLITGCETPSYLIAILYAKIKKIPITMWWESHILSSRFHGGPIMWVKKWILNHVDSFCAVSNLAKEYLLHQVGISEKNIVKAINTVDVYRWRDTVIGQRKVDRLADPRLHFLFVGQFIKRKGILELLIAFKNVSMEEGFLRLVGYGPQEMAIQNFIAQNNMENVEIVGATNTIESTAYYYSWADVLVMPSLNEVWGLVVNEALASGVYVMASKLAGATYDLIENAPYDVGISFDPSEKENFKRAFNSVIEKRKTIDRNAIISWGLTHTPELYADSLMKAILVSIN